MWLLLSVTPSPLLPTHFTEKELTHIETVLYFLAFACGIQNALCTTWSGAVIRTTHYTPTITDLGIVVGNWIREKLGWKRRREGNESDIWKITVCNWRRGKGREEKKGHYSNGRRHEPERRVSSFFLHMTADIFLAFRTVTTRGIHRLHFWSRSLFLFSLWRPSRTRSHPQYVSVFCFLSLTAVTGLMWRVVARRRWLPHYHNKFQPQGKKKTRGLIFPQMEMKRKRDKKRDNSCPLTGGLKIIEPIKCNLHRILHPL